MGIKPRSKFETIINCLAHIIGAGAAAAAATWVTLTLFGPIPETSAPQTPPPPEIILLEV